MPVPLRPFTPQHIDIARKGLRNITDARELMDKYERCGGDCKQDRELADYIETSLEGFRQEFLEPLPRSQS